MGTVYSLRAYMGLGRDHSGLETSEDHEDKSNSA